MDTAWQAAFLESTADISPDATPQQSAERLRQLIRSKMLLLTDMADNPERFFLAHRLLSRMLVDGFGIRFTVQFNLFGGTVLKLGTERHHYLLPGIDALKDVGCFGLSELGYGNNAVEMETTATYDPATDELVVNTPTTLAQKYWITNGAVHAKHVVVMAQLIVKGKNEGIHAVLVRMRDDQLKTIPGVTIEDTGDRKSVV